MTQNGPDSCISARDACENTSATSYVLLGGGHCSMSLTCGVRFPLTAQLKLDWPGRPWRWSRRCPVPPHSAPDGSVVAPLPAVNTPWLVGDPQESYFNHCFTDIFPKIHRTSQTFQQVKASRDRFLSFHTELLFRPFPLPFLLRLCAVSSSPEDYLRQKQRISSKRRCRWSSHSFGGATVAGPGESQGAWT